MMRFHFLPLFLCGAMLLSTVAHAQDKPPEVSNDNFVSLGWARWRGRATVSDVYTLQNHTIIWNSGKFARDTTPAPQTRTLSNAEWKELLAQLKTLCVPAIAGDYTPKNLSDASGDALTLTLSDSSNLDQKFTIVNGGGHAPPAYHKFTAYLLDLCARRFSFPAQPNTSTTRP